MRGGEMRTLSSEDRAAKNLVHYLGGGVVHHGADDALLKGGQGLGDLCVGRARGKGEGGGGG